MVILWPLTTGCVVIDEHGSPEWVRYKLVRIGDSQLPASLPAENADAQPGPAADAGNRLAAADIKISRSPDYSARVAGSGGRQAFGTSPGKPLGIPPDMLAEIVRRQRAGASLPESLSTGGQPFTGWPGDANPIPQAGSHVETVFPEVPQSNALPMHDMMRRSHPRPIPTSQLASNSPPANSAPIAGGTSHLLSDQSNLPNSGPASVRADYEVASEPGPNEVRNVGAIVVDGSQPADGPFSQPQPIPAQPQETLPPPQGVVGRPPVVKEIVTNAPVETGNTATIQQRQGTLPAASGSPVQGSLGDGTQTFSSRPETRNENGYLKVGPALNGQSLDPPARPTATEAALRLQVQVQLLQEELDKSNRRGDVLESELRLTVNTLMQANAALSQSQKQLSSARTEIEDLRLQIEQMRRMVEENDRQTAALLQQLREAVIRSRGNAGRNTSAGRGLGAAGEDAGRPERFDPSPSSADGSSMSEPQLNPAQNR